MLFQNVYLPCDSHEIITNHFAVPCYMSDKGDLLAMNFSGIESKRLRSGDTRAFNRLYAAFAPRVLAYLLHLTGGIRTEAEDLTQETFLAAYAARSEVSAPNLLPWLFGVARRRQRDAFRASTTRPRTASFESDELEGAEQPVSEAVTRRVVLQSALDKLDAPDRDAILLTIVQGLTYAEAATVTGEPIGTVKWRVHVGTKRLRSLLSGTFAEEHAAMNTRKENHSHVEIERAKAAL